eukprot:2339475-Rhodomonas_salina.2
MSGRLQCTASGHCDKKQSDSQPESLRLRQPQRPCHGDTQAGDRHSGCRAACRLSRQHRDCSSLAVLQGQ